jgi:O-antigen/teichoic acid export membrane protein
LRLLFRNLAATYTVYAAAIVSGLLLTPVIVRELGATGYGIWSLVGSLTVVVGLLDVGIGPSVIRHAAASRGRGQPEETNAVASVALLLYLGLAVVAVVGGIVAAIVVPTVVDLPAGSVDETRAAILLAVAGVAVALPLGLFADLLLAQQRFDVVNVANLVSIVAYAATVGTVFLTGNGGLVQLAAITLATTVLRFVLPLRWLGRELPSLALGRRYVTMNGLRALVAFSLDNFAIHVAAKLAFSVDVIVVAIVLGPEDAGYYGIASRLFALVIGASTAGSSMLLPALSELEGARERERQRRLTLAGLRAGTAIAVVLALPLILVPDFLIEAWIGPGFEESVPALALLGVAVVVHQPVNVLSQFFIAQARQRALAWIALARGVANVLLSVVLALAVGLWGVALATVVTEAVAAVVLVPLAARGFERGIPARELAIAAVRPLVPGVVAAAPLLVGLPRWLGTDSLGSLAPVGLAWIATAAVALWLFGLSADDREAVRRLAGPSSRPPVADQLA